MCRKRTLEENSSMGQGVRSQRQSDTRLAYKACFEGLVESNMEQKLGQRLRDANLISKTQRNPLQCIFNEPIEGNIGSFSRLESLKKRKRRLHQGTFFRNILVDSKKG
jgi:hypothetical protein